VFTSSSRAQPRGFSFELLLCSLNLPTMIAKCFQGMNSESFFFKAKTKITSACVPLVMMSLPSFGIFTLKVGGFANATNLQKELLMLFTALNYSKTEKTLLKELRNSTTTDSSCFLLPSSWNIQSFEGHPTPLKPKSKIIGRSFDCHSTF
jgi:hypothetical protein